MVPFFILTRFEKMSQLSNNIRFLRKKAGLTQTELADKLGINRAMISTYEEARSEPKLITLQHIAKFFGYNIHQLVEEAIDGNSKAATDASGQHLRILPIIVDASQKTERITLIPEKASAGYTTGYSDAEYVQSLPHFHLPFPEVSQPKSYRVFQTKGDSMLPIEEGDYLICEYVTDWHELKDHHCYVVVTKNEGVVYKRIINKIEATGDLLLQSDNPAYDPYSIKGADILEIWKSLGYTSFKLPDGKQQFFNLQSVADSLNELKEEISLLKAK